MAAHCTTRSCRPALIQRTDEPREWWPRGVRRNASCEAGLYGQAPSAGAGDSIATALDAVAADVSARTAH